jgi:hypothetical protein
LEALEMHQLAEPERLMSNQTPNMERQVLISACGGGAFISASDFDQKTFLLGQCVVLTFAALILLMVALAFALG